MENVPTLTIFFSGQCNIPPKGDPDRCSVTWGGDPAQRAKKILFLQRYIAFFGPSYKASQLPQRLLQLQAQSRGNEDDFFSNLNCALLNLNLSFADHIMPQSKVTI